jgi:HEAT repeat protein
MVHWSRKTRLPLAAAWAVALLCAGCQWMPGAVPVRPLALDAAPQAGAAADREVLARSVAPDPRGTPQSVWVHAIDAVPYRWRYAHLEEMVARPAPQRPDFRRAAADADIVVATNASIALSRVGDASAVGALERAARTATLPMPMRCAAIEGIASINAPSAAHALRGLLQQYQGDGQRTANGYTAELHAELLRGLARHAEPADDALFEHGLRSRSAEVKLAALTRWKSGGELPREVVDLRRHNDPRVRAAVLEALQRSRSPEAIARAAEALNDTELSVRITAIRCLGDVGGDEAHARLRPMLQKHQSEAIRAAAVAALAKADSRRDVYAAIDDESWRVRMKVAESLAKWPDGESALVARKLLTDVSSHVQRQVVASIAGWPVDLSGPLLLTAMESPAFNLRREATDALAARWHAAGEYQFDAVAERRGEVIDQLRLQFQREYPSAAMTAAAAKPAEFSASEAASLAGHLGQLASLQITERRRAATELARLAAQRPLPPQAVDEIVARGAAEEDVLVWQSLLPAVARGGPAAHQLAYAGLSHPSAEVRRRACEWLAAEPHPQHARVLLPSLDDRNLNVAAAALRALGAGGQIDDVAPVRRLLGSSNAQVAFEAAAALSRVGDRAGLAALERMAYHDDPQLQRQAAEAMGGLADPSFVPALLRLLDGHVSVQRAALASLPRCVGADVAEEGPAPQNTSERIARWRRWAEQQHRPPTTAAQDAPPVIR